MVALLGDVLAAPGSHAEKKRLLMDGLCGLVEADAWAWTLSQFVPGQAPTYVGFLHGGFDDGRFARYLDALEHADMKWMLKEFAEDLVSHRNHITRLRDQVVQDEYYLASPVSKLFSAANIGPIIISGRPVTGGGVSGIGLYRNGERAMFTERESQIAHIVLTEVAWLHDWGWPEDRGESVVKLTPRQRTVLNALIQGWCRKKIAVHLGLSVHTVHGYIKAVFSHFGVHSQAELISRFSWGSGGLLAKTSHVGNGAPH